MNLRVAIVKAELGGQWTIERLTHFRVAKALDISADSSEVKYRIR